MYINLDEIPDISKIKKRVKQLSENIDELKEEIFSLTIDVERLQECEKMEQEEKQEKKYIVHRRNESGGEIYIGEEFVYEIYGEKYYDTTTDIKKATKFIEGEAIRIRNEKNKHYENCLMLWVISEAK